MTLTQNTTSANEIIPAPSAIKAYGVNKAGKEGAGEDAEIDEYIRFLEERLGREIPDVPPQKRQALVDTLRRLGKAHLIPKEWSVTTETAKSLETTLLLGELIAEKKLVVQEPTAENGGVMRMRVPFYVGGSLSRAPGFSKRIYFPPGLAASVVQEAKADIARGEQPLTVFARHSHAATHDHLPVGDVVDVELEGSKAYGILEVAPTSVGKDVQVLVATGKLRAVSLRASDFQMEDKKVDGELMLECTHLRISGIDFAPEGPAQPTYGIEVLAAEAVVEDIPTPDKEESVVPDLTLETLRKEHPALVTELEAPIKATVAEVEKERDSAKARVIELEATVKTFETKETKREIDAKLEEISSKFPEPAKARELLQELCKDAKSAEDVAVKAFPVLMQAMEKVKETKSTETRKTPAELLQEMFREGGTTDTDSAQDTKPRGETVMGLVIPE